MLHKCAFTGRFAMISLLIAVFLIIGTNKSSAQEFCNDETVFWFENFGTGITPSSHPDIIPGSLTYQPSGVLSSEGTYRVINNTQQMPEWHFSADHTPNDIDGKVMVINGQSETFFRHVINLPTGFAPGPYASSLYLMNVNTPGTCAPDPLLPYINFRVEYLNQNGAWVDMQNSPVSSNFVQQSANPTWVLLGGVFILPPTGVFTVTQIRVTLSNQTSGGCGNDYAIDDIKFASCPSGGPVPVTFERVAANRKGSGVQVSWSTSTEINNDRFEVERSSDGRDWQLIATVKGRGYSNTLATYEIYDAKPEIGRNLYRIRQVDTDGRSSYSITVSVQVKADGTTVSLLNNPVANKITLDFLSESRSNIRVRMVDMSGRLVSTKALFVQSGAQRLQVDIPAGTASGLYILQLTDEHGQVIFNEKIIKL